MDQACAYENPKKWVFQEKFQKITNTHPSKPCPNGQTLAPLLREATLTGNGGNSTVGFQSAPLLREATCRHCRFPDPAEGFNPRLSCERRPPSSRCTTSRRTFQSAPLLREATEGVEGGEELFHVSIRASLARGDPGGRQRDPLQTCFNPRLSCERRRDMPRLSDETWVSIRASLARGDNAPRSTARTSSSFNPRLSCERRPSSSRRCARCGRFQSAPLLREATTHRRDGSDARRVSIRASLARGDSPEAPGVSRGGLFQSAPLLREATVRENQVVIVIVVSIRASLARGDRGSQRLRRPCAGFNPRLSCERRLLGDGHSDSARTFQSAPLLREATSSPALRVAPCMFQSAPLLREATISSRLLHSILWFQSAPLLREATYYLPEATVELPVSIRASLARGDPMDAWSFARF